MNNKFTYKWERDENPDHPLESLVFVLDNGVKIYVAEIEDWQNIVTRRVSYVLTIHACMREAWSFGVFEKKFKKPEDAKKFAEKYLGLSANNDLVNVGEDRDVAIHKCPCSPTAVTINHE